MRPSETDLHPEAQEFLSKGLALSRADDGPGAVAWFTAAAQSDPRHALPYFLLACEHAAMGEVDQAEIAFAQTLLLADQFHIARFQLGLLQFSSNRPAIALLTWQSLLSLPDDSPLPCFVRGFSLLAQDQFKDAQAQFERGMSKNEGNEPLNQDIARVVAQIKALPGSEMQDDQAHVLLANYQQQGQYRQ